VGGYEVAPWADFAVGVAGAAAALTGLLFVAVSVNIHRIMQLPNLPGRAGQTLITLITPLLVSIFLLVPNQPRDLLGSELIGLGLILGCALVWLNRPGTKSHEESWGTWAAGRFGPAILASTMIVFAGTSLVAEAGGGLYWLAPAVLLAILAGLMNAWVLLIEILR
jgi:hypothetical protein